jgi:hypothetical protein
MYFVCALLLLLVTTFKQSYSLPRFSRYLKLLNPFSEFDRILLLLLYIDLSVFCFLELYLQALSARHNDVMSVSVLQQ